MHFPHGTSAARLYRPAAREKVCVCALYELRVHGVCRLGSQFFVKILNFLQENLHIRAREGRKRFLTGTLPQ